MKKIEKYERLLNKEKTPDEGFIKETIGPSSYRRWKKLKDFLDAKYDFTPELVFFGKLYGWSLKYRKSGKTLCTLFPETGAFTVLVVMGIREIEEFRQSADQFNAHTIEVFEKAYQYHDGKWLYKRVITEEDLNDVMMVIMIKKKPKDLRKS
jgi:hypothetical protein